MVNIKYYRLAAYDAGEMRNPVEVLKSLGLSMFSYFSVDVADCVIIGVDRMPDPCPPFIEPFLYPMPG